MTAELAPKAEALRAAGDAELPSDVAGESRSDEAGGT